jgi:hypothetical protein
MSTREVPVWELFPPVKAAGFNEDEPRGPDGEWGGGGGVGKVVTTAGSYSWNRHMSNDAKMDSWTETSYTKVAAWLRDVPDNAHHNPLKNLTGKNGPSYDTPAWHTANVDDVMRHSTTTEDATVFRALGTNRWSNGLKVGDSYKDKAFVSTTSNEKSIHSWASNWLKGGGKTQTPVFAKINVPTGMHAFYQAKGLTAEEKADGVPKSEGRDFDELTLDRGLTFTITGLEERTTYGGYRLLTIDVSKP